MGWGGAVQDFGKRRPTTPRDKHRKLSLLKFVLALHTALTSFLPQFAILREKKITDIRNTWIMTKTTTTTPPTTKSTSILNLIFFYSTYKKKVCLRNRAFRPDDCVCAQRACRSTLSGVVDRPLRVWRQLPSGFLQAPTAHAQIYLHDADVRRHATKDFNFHSVAEATTTYAKIIQEQTNRTTQHTFLLLSLNPIQHLSLTYTENNCSPFKPCKTKPYRRIDKNSCTAKTYCKNVLQQRMTKKRITKNVLQKTYCKNLWQK